MRRISLLILLAALLVPAQAFAGDGLEFTVTPNELAINALFDGATLSITGKIPAESQAIVRFIGLPETIHMKWKEKALGLLWMNRQSVNFHDAPSVCLTAATKGVDEAARQKYGVEGVRDRIEVESAEIAKDAALKEFLLFKETAKLYLDNAGQVSLDPETDGFQTFHADLRLPSRITPGDYTLEVFALRDGEAIATGLAHMNAKFVGAPAMLASMAFNHGAIYGILAVIIAILGGLVIGRIFQGSGDGAH
jgi:hypothetical protein